MPSSISSVFCVVVSLILTLGVIFINRYNSSSLRLEYQYYQAHRTISNSSLTGSITQNQIVTNLPLIIFWLLVGVIIYIASVDIIKGIRSAVELRKELNYVNVHRVQLIRDTTVRIFLRLLVVAIWLPYLIIFFHHIIPYSVKVAILATTASNALHVAGYVVLSLAITAVAIHINLILFRLLLQRPRVISSTLDWFALGYSFCYKMSYAWP